MTSSWKEQFGRLGPVRTVVRAPSGSPVAIALRAGPDRAAIRTVSAALALCGRGATMLRAKRAVEEVLESGRAVILLPLVSDVGALTRELADLGFAASILASDPVDVRALRDDLGLTQEQFALRYGLELDAVQNWETGRRSPDRAARSYLKVIRHLPLEASVALEEAPSA